MAYPSKLLYALVVALGATALPTQETRDVSVADRQTTPITQRGYAAGSCSVHVTQYQKNEGPPASTGGTSDYRLNVALFDANAQDIGGVTSVDAVGNQAVDVDSQLPSVMEVTVGQVDADTIRFAYAGQTWDSAVSLPAYPQFIRKTEWEDAKNPPFPFYVRELFL